MKYFFTTLGLFLLVLGALIVKVYWNIIDGPQYYLNQVGAAINAHNLADFEKWVDLESVARGVVNDYFTGLTKQPEASTTSALEAELTPVLTEQVREYVRNGQFMSAAQTNLSKRARLILAQLTISNDDVRQFQELAFVKENGQNATAGLKSTATLGGSLIVELKLQRVKSGWRVVRIANFTDIKTRLQRHEKQKSIKVEDLLVQGVKNSVIWGKFDREETVLDLSSSAVPAWPSSLAIHLDEQEHLCFTLIGATYKFSLQFNPGQAEAFEENGFLNKHYYVQAGEYDFDGDNQAELVIAIGDNNIDLVVNIFKYNSSPQGNPAGPNNWSLVKVFMGQKKAYINGRNIRLPYTAVNVEAEYQWRKNGFQEIH